MVSARADQYWDLCREGTTQGQFGLLDALDVYESFHMIQLHDDWDEEGFPWGCVCLQCQKWTVCEHSALLASLFRDDVEVPHNLVAETPALRKKCNKLRGTAGPRRARILKAIAKEKKTSTSKLDFVNDPVPPQPDPPPLAPVAPVSARDASPLPAQCFNQPSPNMPTPSTSEDEADPKAGPKADPKPAATGRTARTAVRSSAPKVSKSGKEVHLDSLSVWLILTTRPGRPALPPRNLPAGSAQLRPRALPLSPSRDRQTTRYTTKL